MKFNIESDIEPNIARTGYCKFIIPFLRTDFLDNNKF